MEGKKVPSFEWKDQNGNDVTDKNLLGSHYVLYFYPKDDTPGCTKEACGIRDAWEDFRQAGLKVYGVSKDGETSHQRFIDKYELPFDLLIASTDDMESFGVWKQKSLYGKTFLGISRETFLVGPDGTVLKHYAKVKPAEHADQILQDFAALA